MIEVLNLVYFYLTPLRSPWSSESIKHKVLPCRGACCFLIYVKHLSQVYSHIFSVGKYLPVFGCLVESWRSIVRTCSSLNNHFPKLEFSVSALQSLVMTKRSVISPNNLLNRDGAVHYEIFKAQFFSSIRLGEDP